MEELKKYDQNTKMTVKEDSSLRNPVIYYQSVDASHYSFKYRFDDGVEIDMTESDRYSKKTEFVDAEFEEEIPESEMPCYIAAATSGILTGLLRSAGLADHFDDKIEQFKNEKEWRKYVVKLASKLGYMKSDFSGAVKYLADMSISIIGEKNIDDVKKQVKTCLSKASAHPTVVGLIFSITSQFSGHAYIFEEGELKDQEFPDYYAIGRNYHEKVMYGLLYWVFDLAVNVAYANRNIIDDLHMPKEIINLLKTFLGSEVMKDVPQNYDEAIRAYSGWIKKLFEDTELVDDEGMSGAFDLEENINASMKGLFRDIIPIVLNECIVRGFYFIHKFSYEIKRNGISSISDLNKIAAEDILPFNNRVVSRMSVISSFTFTGINFGSALLDYVKGKKVSDRSFKEVLLETIDIPGICRLCIAVAMDSEYWKDDINIILEKIKNNINRDDVGGNASVEDDHIIFDEKIFEKFTLDAIQARILYSFEAIAVGKDIERTDKQDDKKLKREWLDLWKSRILMGQASDKPGYFVADEDILYEGLFELSKKKENMSWLYLMGTDLVLFDPYHPLGVEKDRSYGKLKKVYDYIGDQFIRRQTIVSQSEVDSFRSKYKKYYNSISGNTSKLASTIGITAAVTAATGGLAFAFAPSIAVVLAGEAVAGLHGAALTSASLAFIGGGSLAAGGLGMAGGTAIIAGGGALLGLASSAGTTSVAGVLSQMDDDTLVKLAAKMAAFCDIVVVGQLNDLVTLKNLIDAIDRILMRSRNELEELKEEDNDLDKKMIDKLKKYIKIMTRLREILVKIMESN